MTSDYTKKGKFMITMYDHINNIINKAPEMYKSGFRSATDAPTHLYAVPEPQDRN